MTPTDNLTTIFSNLRHPLVRTHFVLMTVISLALFGRLEAATITANSASRTDVGAAIAAAVDGDTVMIPAGSAHWTTNVYITKAITLQGAGTNSSTGTIIYDDVPENAESIPPYRSAVFHIDTSVNKFYRLSGIQIAPTTTRKTGYLTMAQVVVSGSSKAIRVDHCWFGATPCRQRAISWYGATCGVVDHCTLLNTTRDVDVFHSTWGGQNYGDGSWADDSTVGTTNTVVIEDCYMEGASSTQAFTDAFDGGRYCVRHCTLRNGHLDSHEGGSRTRATRQIEVYNNSMTADDGNGVGLYVRGGSVLVFSNTMTGCANLALLANYRSFVVYAPWGGVSGTNVWDNNAPTAAATGTYTGPDGSATTMVDANANWTPNQWVGYAIQNTSPKATNAFGHLHSVVVANTSNTITFSQWSLVWTNGNTYALYYVTNGLDMCGMGKGDLISGDNPSPVGWPHQQLDPCYQWGNSPPNLSFVACPTIRENVHYYNNVAKPGYTPLVYPHPLVETTTNQGSLVLPPSNVRAFPAYAGR